ncbi:MAG TPA: c-type cytochrome biogenesis protein CcmI [Xanthobacteraceae bacterium]|nr:c-type cytochrome biogenesis protein CcmI [Xanthobacteraceae bacterium]
MTLWSILLLMTAAALSAVIWPLARPRTLRAAGSDLAVYRDQLEEIERDRADGRIGHDEFEAARIEVSRRVLGAASAGPGTPESAPSGRRRIAALVGAVIAVLLIAGSLYTLLGSPNLPGESIASRDPGAEQANSIAALIARIETHLKENPKDGRGWEVLAPVYMKLERYDDAVQARRNALSLLGVTPEREVDLGEALASAAGGVITADAKAAFERAVALAADNVKARFYLGLAAQQDGNGGEAARIWRDLIATAPANAPWLAMVRQSLARVERPGATSPAPRPDDIAAASEMTPEGRNEMIRGMVERLATRLHEDGSDVEGWLRLLRAYMVMGERDKAKAAVGEARGALAREPEKLKQLDEGIRDLGVEG